MNKADFQLEQGERQMAIAGGIAPSSCTEDQQEISELRGSQEQMRQANIVLARELAEAREQVEALKDAITRGGSIGIQAGNLNAIAYHLEQGQDNGNLSRQGLAAQLKSVAARLKNCEEAATKKEQP